MARRDFDASPVTPNRAMELLVGDQRSDGNRIRFPPSRPGGEIIPRQCKPGGAAGGRREKKEQRKDQPRGHKNARPEQLRQPRLTSLRLPPKITVSTITDCGMKRRLQVSRGSAKRPPARCALYWTCFTPSQGAKHNSLGD